MTPSVKLLQQPRVSVLLHLHTFCRSKTTRQFSSLQSLFCCCKPTSLFLHLFVCVCCCKLEHLSANARFAVRNAFAAAALQLWKRPLVIAGVRSWGHPGFVRKGCAVFLAFNDTIAMFLNAALPQTVREADCSAAARRHLKIHLFF